jgi:HSP20 family protein
MSENNMVQAQNSSDKVQVNGRETHEQAKYQLVTPASDIEEAKEDYVVNIDMPGLNPSDIEVKLDKEILTVEAKAEVEGLPPRIYRRQFRVMKGLDASQCRADYKQGVLTLKLAKPKSAKPQQIKIQSE